MPGKTIELIMVSEDNNNKFYRMTENNDGTWIAHWGRVGTLGESQVYPMGVWDKKYREKERKGYRDITLLVSVDSTEQETTLNVLGASPKVVNLVNYLQSCANSTIKSNYTVKAKDVTEKQINAAQFILDELIEYSKRSKLEIQDVNKKLIELYTTIPRKMENTKNYLLQKEDPALLNKFLSGEQDLLDVMRGQVGTVKSQGTSINNFDLSSFGIEISEALDYDRDLIGRSTDFDVSKAKRIFVINNVKTKNAMINDSSPLKLLYHGSRNQNWWSIITSGLMIRPINAIKSGNMFGFGIYFANKAKKSIGYTSLRGSYWASGTSDTAFLALYSVNTGKEWDLLKNQTHSYWMNGLTLDKVNKEGYDSVYARGGYDLRNEEFIIYEGSRCTIKYLIELGGKDE